jgi:phage tail P2-like protein
MKDSWAEGRPVFNRLPLRGYQDNETVDALTVWVDEKLTDTAKLLEGLPGELSPSTCQDKWLDYLGFLVGLSGSYWDIEWSSSVKRAMITEAHRNWGRRGTIDSIRGILDIHGFEYKLWTSSSLRLSFTLPATFGSDNLRLFIRLPLRYQRTSKEFKEAGRTLRNYAPVLIEAKEVFDGFYLGFSKIGDPLFK